MRSVILTRPIHQAEAFAELLRNRFSANVHCCPLIEIVFEQVRWPDSSEGVIFTSANAVASVPPVQGLQAVCVGEATKQAALDLGYKAISADGTSDDVFSLMTSDVRFKNANWFYPHGAHVTGDLVERLRAQGFTIEDGTSYRQISRVWTVDERQFALKDGNVFPVFSPNGAKKLVSALGDGLPQDASFLAISDQTADSLDRVAYRSIKIAARPTRDAMLDLIGEELEVQH